MEPGEQHRRNLQTVRDFMRARPTPSPPWEEADASPATAAPAPPHPARRQTKTEYTTEWGLVGGQVKHWHWPWAVACGALGIGLLGLGALGLLLYWPVGLGLIVAGVLLLRVPNQGIWGAWLGNCPHCRKEVAVADATKSVVIAPILVVCPYCANPIAVTSGIYTAMEPARPPQS